MVVKFLYSLITLKFYNSNLILFSYLQQRKDQRSNSYDVNMQPQQVQHNQPQPQIVSQEIYDSSQQQIPQIFDNFFTGTGPAGTLTPPSVSTIYPAQDEGYITFSGKYLQILHQTA